MSKAIVPSNDLPISNCVSLSKAECNYFVLVFIHIFLTRVVVHFFLALPIKERK
jgi:hypothetical protein